jgi:hypothetical protein
VEGRACRGDRPVAPSTRSAKGGSAPLCLDEEAVGENVASTNGKEIGRILKHYCGVGTKHALESVVGYWLGS